MKTLMIAAALATASLVSGCATYGDEGPSYAVYDYNHPDPAFGYYDAGHYYRDAPRYHERMLTRDDRLYRGREGRYYCRRSDGTTGLVVGALAGGVLGDALAPGGSETLGVLVGAGTGAVIGQAIDQSNARCR